MRYRRNPVRVWGLSSPQALWADRMAALICGGSCWRLSPDSVDQSFRLLTGPPWAAAGDVVASASSAVMANVFFMVAGPPELSPLVATGLGQLCYIGQHRRHGGRCDVRRLCFQAPSSFGHKTRITTHARNIDANRHMMANKPVYPALWRRLLVVVSYMRMILTSLPEF